MFIRLDEDFKMFVLLNKNISYISYDSACSFVYVLKFLQIRFFAASVIKYLTMPYQNLNVQKIT